MVSIPTKPKSASGEDGANVSTSSGHSSASSPRPRTKKPSLTAKLKAPKLKSKNKPKTTASELYSLSKLAELFDMDRAVARRLLQAAKIKPTVNTEKKKLYPLTPEVEAALEKAGEPRLDEVKLREAEAKARLKELEVEKRSGRLVDFDEMADQLSKLFKRLHDYFVLEYPRRNSARLRKCKSAGELANVLRHDHAKIFGELRTDFRRFLS